MMQNKPRPREKIKLDAMGAILGKGSRHTKSKEVPEDQSQANHWGDTDASSRVHLEAETAKHMSQFS